MKNSLGSRILGIILMTFVIAALYGFAGTTMDFLKTGYDPVASGQRVSNNIYGLFGVVGQEVKRDEVKADESPRWNDGIAKKIASPYAVTADVAAVICGKLEVGLFSFFASLDHKVAKENPHA